MSATINLEKEKHFPVLIDELVSIISPLYGGTFIDCTFGQGSYSKKILEYKNNKIIALDRDTDTFNNANWLKKQYKDRFYFENKKFSEIDKIKINLKNLKAIIFDLGYSLNQIKDSIKNNNKDQTELRQSFYKWFVDFDNLRNLNFVETFPELKEFYKMCGELNDRH